MAILLAAELAQRRSGIEIRELVAQAVLRPLGMHHSVLGHDDRLTTMPCQVEHSAPEAGGGAPGSESWNWNSPYWRALGSPWGGVQASAADVGRFLDAFIHPDGSFLRPETARLVVQNHNPDGMMPRGLGFEVSQSGGFGHSGSTGTLAWANPESEEVGVVLTTLPASGITPHPRQRALEALLSS